MHAVDAACRPDMRDHDPWSQIRRVAVDVAAREPFLRHLLVETVLSRETPSHIVGATLARRLAPDRDPGLPLQTLVTDTLQDDPALVDVVAADLLAVLTRDPACRSVLHALLHLKGFHALQTHRVAHALWKKGRCDIAHWLASQASLRFGVDIHPAVTIGPGVVLDHATGIVIGETAVVEDGVTIFQGVTLGATGHQRGDRHPKVRSGALVGAGAQVLGNIEVGRMSRVGAGSVVLDPVPAHCTVTGVPARVVRTRAPDCIASVLA
jgi:serine O-acetyltransferase